MCSVTIAFSSSVVSWLETRGTLGGPPSQV
jgi:hypothetical protein